MPLLAPVFNAVGVLGGWLGGRGADGRGWRRLLGPDAERRGRIGVTWAMACSRAVVFGIAVTFVACSQGYAAKPTPEGVSRATTRTVVVASLARAGAGLCPRRP